MRRPAGYSLRWPERDLLVLSPLVRLLWGSFIDELLTTYDKKQGSGCNPVLLLIDEAGRTAIPMLADFATTVVGRKVYLWISVQNLSQLETVYGRTRADTLRDNCESQIYYRPNHLSTAKYINERLGERSGFAQSKTLHPHDTTSQGLSERPVSLLTPQAIMQMKDNQIIGFHRDYPPFMARRMDWQRYKLFIERRGLTPPPIPALPKIDEAALAPIPQAEAERAPGYIDPDHDSLKSTPAENADEVTVFERRVLTPKKRKLYN